MTSSSVPHSPFKKRHHALSYHFTREAIASNVLDFQHIPGDINPVDILSKHWGYSQIWPTLQPMLFWMGDTATLFPKNGPVSGEGMVSSKPTEDSRPKHQLEGSDK